MSTPHNRANPGDFAKTVLMPGDPLRAKFIAETFLENPRLVTDVRGMLGYTGTYQGHPVSVMGGGMGMPSIGIYSYELYSQYGVENIIRVGSAGSYTEKAKVFDVVLATGAYSESNYAVTQSGDTDTIQLDQFLKWAGVTTTGGDIRILLENRQIKRNGETESAKRRKLVPGDVIEVEGVGSYEVVKE